MSRRERLCAQHGVGQMLGIDFVAVSPDHTRVDVVLLNGDAGNDDNQAVLDAIPLDAIRVEGVDSGRRLSLSPPDPQDPSPHPFPGRARRMIRVAGSSVDEPFTVTIDHDAFDLYLRSHRFHFAQACPSEADCRPADPCGLPTARRPDIDYLARDFESLREGALAFMRGRTPAWQEPLEADMAVMLVEIMAAIGDEFAYLQDQAVAETSFATARQRRSIEAMARLVNYRADPGTAPQVDLACDVAGPAELVVPPDAWWQFATVEDGSGVTFTSPPDHFLGREREVQWRPRLHERWNSLRVYLPDADAPCLDPGQPWIDVIAPPGAAAALADLRPDDGPKRPVLVHDGAGRVGFRALIDSVEQRSDELPEAGGTVELLRISFTPDGDVPRGLRLAGAEVRANVLRVLAGRTVVEDVIVAPDGGLASLPSPLEPRLHVAIEREGPSDRSGQRSRIVRHGLRAAEREGLAWITPPRDQVSGGLDPRPLVEVASIADGPGHEATPWGYIDSIDRGDADQTLFTVEPGTWRDVVSYQSSGRQWRFGDYATENGFTIRFGDDRSTLGPTPGSRLRARYVTGAGTEAHLGPGRWLYPVREGDDAVPAAIRSATNPLAVTPGRAAESLASIRLSAPELFRALPLRAVRPEDYVDIAERLAWVQQAGCISRWTGSWSTDFVTADDIDAPSLSPAREAELRARADVVRQAAREVRVEPPRYLDVDVWVQVCVEPAAYPGEVLPRVVDALASPGFFSPANFTFGSPLRRGALEAAVQAVPGVLAVESVRIRSIRSREWRELDEDLEVDQAEIIRVVNDALAPGAGSIRVVERKGAQT